MLDFKSHFDSLDVERGVVVLWDFGQVCGVFLYIVGLDPLTCISIGNVFGTMNGAVYC